MSSDRDNTKEGASQGSPSPMADLLAVHLEDREEEASAFEMDPAQQAELESLLLIARRLDAHMTPHTPSPTFVRSLGEELVNEARRRAARREKRHRVAVVGAAIAGGVVSIASLVGGIVVLVKWLRTRTDAPHPSTA